MRNNIRFLWIVLLNAVFVLNILASETSACPGMTIASQYPIVVGKPAPDFFEGALLGNGGMGIVVTTRPDAICLHFGHNNVWDIRVTEEHKDEIGTFDEIFKKAKALPEDLPSIWHDKDFADYLSLTADNYRSSYPRPFPCGTLLIGFDSRDVELLGHTLDISNGTCRVSLLRNGHPLVLSIVVDMDTDAVWMSLTDKAGHKVESCFNRIRIIPDSSTPGDIPHYEILEAGEHHIGFSQVLPFLTNGTWHEKDRKFALQVYTNNKLVKGSRMNTLGQMVGMADMERSLDAGADREGFLVKVCLQEGLNKEHDRFLPVLPELTQAAYEDCVNRSNAAWNAYWTCSSVSLADKELEQMWYRNLYFFNCAIRKGVTCPGIFANWSLGNIGTAWHGDYHLNYNTQQPFWLTFSSNHLDKNLVYADLVDHLLPVSKKWAKEYYGMDGAFFPHSAYPVEMNLHPYPVPDWGWEVFETPWIVQGLWWHYLYSADKTFLRERAFVPIKEAVKFLVDYMMREDAHGSLWNDDRYHIFPSVPPELYGLQPGFKFNYDTQIDITMTKFIFKAYCSAVDILGLRKGEAQLVKKVGKILSRMPEYPTSWSREYGKIYVSVPGEQDGIVYNVPANLTHVFPGEEFGLSSPDSIKTVLANTVKAHRNEGGNDIVFANLQKARLGMLDLDKFKRLVNYATLPNQTVTDAVTAIGGRYSDNTDYMYMGNMGIWFENFALPAVINECLMQSYDGTIRLFPNWDMNMDAEFNTLRARGAFLVSGKLCGGTVQTVVIASERGGECRIHNPWGNSAVKLEYNGKARILKGDILHFPTEMQCKYVLSPA